MSSNNISNIPHKNRRRKVHDNLGTAESQLTSQSTEITAIAGTSRQGPFLEIDRSQIPVPQSFETPTKYQSMSASLNTNKTFKSDIEQSGQEGKTKSSAGKKKKRQQIRSKDIQGENSSPQAIRKISQAAGRSSPLQNTSMATPTKTAYAGPAFHASPAPSALPMPSFFSKSLPAASPMKDMQQERNASSSESEPDSPTPAIHGSSAVAPAREESPLDFFFKADREQKSRAMRTKSETSKPLTPNAPQSNQSSGQRYSGSPLGARPKNHSRHSTGHSLSGIFPLELEAKSRPETPRGPSQTDVNTIYTNEQGPNPNSSMPTVDADDEARRRASSQALKDLLFASKRPSGSERHTSAGASHDSNIRTENRSRLSASPSTPPYGVDRQKSPETSYSPRPRPRSSGLRQEVTPEDENNAIARRYIEEQLQQNGRPQAERGAPTGFSSFDASVEATKSDNLRDMEKKLRGMLNLGSS